MLFVFMPCGRDEAETGADDEEPDGNGPPDPGPGATEAAGRAIPV